MKYLELDDHWLCQEDDGERNEEKNKQKSPNLTVLSSDFFLVLGNNETNSVCMSLNWVPKRSPMDHTTKALVEYKLPGSLPALLIQLP